MRDKQRVSLYLEDAGQADLAAIKAYYGITSNAAAVRRALTEHARHCKAEATRAEPKITYSRRVH